MAASARDIVPIALSGLAGLLGGPQAAAGIGNAAGTARQMTLDKRDTEDRDKRLAQSARHLELSEEAGKRAEKGLNLTTSRTELLNSQTQQQMKQSEKAIAHFENSRATYLEAMPDLPDYFKTLITDASTPAQLYDAQKLIAKHLNVKSPEQQKIAAQEAQASGISGRFDFEGGSYYSSAAKSSGRAGATARKIQRTINAAMDDYPNEIMNLEDKKAALEDRATKALESGNTKTANQINARIRAIDQQIQGKNTPRGMWQAIEEGLDKIGLDDDSISQIEQQFLEGQSGGEPQAVPADDTDVDAAVARATAEQSGIPQNLPQQTANQGGGTEMIADPITGEPRRRGFGEMGSADTDLIQHVVGQLIETPRKIWRGARQFGENLRQQ